LTGGFKESFGITKKIQFDFTSTTINVIQNYLCPLVDNYYINELIKYKDNIDEIFALADLLLLKFLKRRILKIIVRKWNCDQIFELFDQYDITLDELSENTSHKFYKTLITSNNNQIIRQIDKTTLLLIIDAVDKYHGKMNRYYRSHESCRIWKLVNFMIKWLDMNNNKIYADEIFEKISLNCLSNIKRKKLFKLSVKLDLYNIETSNALKTQLIKIFIKN